LQVVRLPPTGGGECRQGVLQSASQLHNPQILKDLSTKISHSEPETQPETPKVTGRIHCGNILARNINY